MEENKGLLLKSAMTYGLYLGIFWVIKFLFFIFSGHMSGLQAIFIVLSIAVPFIAYYLTSRYKHDIGGNISFFHAWRFGTMLYFFAALLVSLEHFIFFQFIAPSDFITNMLNQTIEMLKGTQIDTETLVAISQTKLSPIHLVIQMIFNNVFYGILLSIPVAAFVCQSSAPDYVEKEQEEKL